MKTNSTRNNGGGLLEIKTEARLDDADRAILVREAHIRRVLRRLAKQQIGDEEKERLARLIGEERVTIPNGFLPRYLGAVITTKTKTDVDTKRLVEAFAQLTNSTETQVRKDFGKTSNPFLHFTEAE